MFIIKKNNINLQVNYQDGEVFILSDIILTAFDLSTRTLASSEASVANEHMHAFNGGEQIEEVTGYFRGRGWQVLDR